MYERFFGLRERPFDLTPDPRYLFLTKSHEEALANLDYGIRAHRGVTLLLGEAGTGKTTLVRAALAAHRAENSWCVSLNNPALTREEFVAFLATSFRLSEAAASSKSTCMQELEACLIARRRRGYATALVVDEAQALPTELLEEVRLLANIETDTCKLLSIVLAGQPELAVRLNRAELRNLKQRVGLRCKLEPMDADTTAAYMMRRIQTAGGRCSDLFTREAWCRFSRRHGVFRGW